MRRLPVAHRQARADRALLTNLYDLIGARPDDDAVGLKTAFRRAVKAHHPDLIPECGKCHTRLPEAGSTTIRRALYRFRIRIVAVPMLGLLAWAVWNVTISAGGKQTSVEALLAAAKQPAPAARCVPYPTPSHGLNDELDRSERPAVLTIRTAGGPFYLVNLEKAASGAPALLFFVYGGQPLDARVPLGEFRLKFAPEAVGAAMPICSATTPFSARQTTR